MPRRSARNKRNAEDIVEEDKSKESEEVQSEEPVIKKSRTRKQTTTKEKERETTNCKDEDFKNASSIYEFTAKDINGEEISLDKYEDHVCIIVNVASRCGHTAVNYQQLNELHDLYAEKKALKILAFPCNQFANQEPGDSKKICEFIKKKNVKFDVFEKIDVNGKNAHPLWKFMKDKISGPKGPNINWNFTKFVIDKDGKVVERFKPAVKPLQLVEHLEKYW